MAAEGLAPTIGPVVVLMGAAPLMEALSLSLAMGAFPAKLRFHARRRRLRHALDHIHAGKCTLPEHYPG